MIGQSTMPGAMHRIAEKCPDIKTIIDVGASDGRWTRIAAQSFPGREHLLFEANHCHERDLDVCESHGYKVVRRVASSKVDGGVYFGAGPKYSGFARKEPFEGGFPVSSTTVDDEVDGMPPAFFLKLDTHGHELHIFEGAKETLKQTVAVMIECYAFKLKANEVLLFDEMIAFMRGIGFRCSDIFDVSRRPLDGLLWQFDAVFLRSDRPEFDDNRYRDHA